MMLIITVPHSEWLIDRSHCDAKWQATSMTIREKINAAIQDMPAVEEITQLLSGTCRCTFHQNTYIHNIRPRKKIPEFPISQGKKIGRVGRF